MVLGTEREKRVGARERGRRERERTLDTERKRYKRRRKALENPPKC